MQLDIGAGHRERMRSRIVNNGIASLKQREVLEFVLFYAIPRRDVKPTAVSLLNMFGNLKGVFSASEAELVKAPSVSVRTAEWIKTVAELMDAYAQLEMKDRPMLDTFSAAKELLSRELSKNRAGETWQYCITMEGRLLRNSLISRQSDWGDIDSLRAAAAFAMYAHAHSAIIVRFVDEPCEKPDEYDVECTMKYAKMLSNLSTQLLDCIIVSPEGVYSLYRNHDLDGIRGLLNASYLRERYLFESPNDG